MSSWYDFLVIVLTIVGLLLGYQNLLLAYAKIRIMERQSVKLRDISFNLTCATILLVWAFKEMI